MDQHRSPQVNPLVDKAASPAILEARAWLEAYRGSGPPLDLSQAAPPYLPPQDMLDRLSAAAASPEVARYGPVQGELRLRTAYARHTSSLYRAEIGTDRIAITAGCNQAFFIAAMLTARCGDAVILPSPYYFNHRMTLDMLGISVVEAPCPVTTHHVPDPETIAELINDRVKAIVLVTPNNPTGAVYSSATIRAFGDLCRQRGIWLIIDETYRDFLAGGPPHDLFIDDVDENVISLYSFSKSLAVPGYRLGAMIYPAQLASAAIKIQDCVQICPTRVGQIAATWALAGLDHWRREKRLQMELKARAFAAAMASCPGWEITSMGAYFAYIRHPFAQMPAKEVAKRLAHENGLLLIPGSYFGEGQEYYLRLSFGNLTDETLATLPERFKL